MNNNLTLENLISFIKTKFTNKIVLEIPKNKSLDEKILYILKLMNNKKVILVSEENEIIKLYEQRQNYKYIIFFNDEFLTITNDNNDNYWIIKKMIDSDGKIATCVICLEEKDNNLNKVICCGSDICFECLIKINVSKCPICRKSWI